MDYKEIACYTFRPNNLQKNMLIFSFSFWLQTTLSSLYSVSALRPIASSHVTNIKPIPTDRCTVKYLSKAFSAHIQTSNVYRFESAPCCPIARNQSPNSRPAFILDRSTARNSWTLALLLPTLIAYLYGLF